MFVELSVARGKELFHVGGILRVVPASNHARIYLFGTQQPIDIQEKYEDVVGKLSGPEMFSMTVEGVEKAMAKAVESVKDDPEVP